MINCVFLGLCHLVTVHGQSGGIEWVMSQVISQVMFFNCNNCDKCNKKVDIKTCMYSFITKTFSYSLTRTKLHDNIQCKPYLDMANYTKQGLEQTEHIIHKVDPSTLTKNFKNFKKFQKIYEFDGDTLYRLNGVINHSGHYTSYMRKRIPRFGNDVNEQGTRSDFGYQSAHQQNAQWLFFNDRSIAEWDSCKIEDDCFDAPSGIANSTKPYSAYMSFYERLASIVRMKLNRNQICHSFNQNEINRVKSW